MRTKPTDVPAKTDTMKHLHLLLLTLASSPAFSGGLRIDPARLQEQVQQHTEQAAQQGGAPSSPAAWLTEPTASPQGHGQDGMGQGAGGGQGYGRGYEHRYGQRDIPAERGSDSPMSGTGQGAGHGMGGGRGRH